MDLIALDDDERLYLSPDIDDWAPLAAAGITAVIDLDAGLDLCVPCVPNQVLYVYFPFNDAGLPNLAKLQAVGQLGATLVQTGHKVLSHCGLGFNRSALMAGVILSHLGWTGPAAVALLRRRRPGALYNQVYADFLSNFQPHVTAEPAALDSLGNMMSPTDRGDRHATPADATSYRPR